MTHILSLIGLAFTLPAIVLGLWAWIQVLNAMMLGGL
jgi:hypothetical protein